MAMAVSISPTASAQSYDDLCDKMVMHAQRAAAAHNQKKFDLVEEEQQLVEETFRKALEIDATEPQAYLNMATFQSNSHQYDASVTNYDKVIEILLSDGDSNQEMRFRVEQARKVALYRKFSQLRDLTYDNGDGNVTLAHQYALEQLKYSPEPQRTNHQLATLEAMLCEYNTTMCTQSHYHFRVATFATFQHVTKFRSENLERSARMKCFHSKLHMGEWAANNEDPMAPSGGLAAAANVLHPYMPPYQNNTRSDLSLNSGIFVNSLKGVYDIVGPDGIIIANSKATATDGDCTVLIQNGDFYVNLADNLFPAPPNAQGPVPLRAAPTTVLPKGTKVLSLVQFASTTFYHWMAEVLPKLIYFRQTFPDAEDYKLLISAKGSLKSASSLPKFVRSSLKMFGVNVEKEVIGYDGNNGLTIDTREGGDLAAVTWDPAPCPGETFSASILERRMCASLTPTEALVSARRVLTELARSQASFNLPQAPYVLVISRGNAVSSRTLNTTAVAKMLREAAAKHIDLLDDSPIDENAPPVNAPLAAPRKSDGNNRPNGPREVTVIEFKDDDHILADAMNLFRGASLIVGPHGGAMANMMACEAGKTTILEVGFSTVAAQQYRHMAISLGLRYRKLVSGPDRLRRALNAPSVIARTEVIVSNAIELLLEQLGENRAVRKTQIPPGPKRVPQPPPSAPQTEFPKKSSQALEDERVATLDEEEEEYEEDDDEGEL